MARLQNPFNAGTVDPTQSAYSLLPTGEYKVVIVDSALKPTKGNDGGYLQVDLKVIEGEHQGAQIPDRLNLYNQNVTASQIAARRFSAICHAVGMGEAIIEDTAVLHNKPFMVRIEQVDGKEYMDRATGTMKPGNKQSEIKMILDINGKPPVKGSAGPAPAQPQQQPPAGFAPPPQAQPPAQQPLPTQAWAPQQQPQQQPQQPATPPQGGTAPAWAMPPGVAPQGQTVAPGGAGGSAAPQQPPQSWGTPPAGAPWGGPQQ